MRLESLVEELDIELMEDGKKWARVTDMVGNDSKNALLCHVRGEVGHVVHLRDTDFLPAMSLNIPVFESRSGREWLKMPGEWYPGETDQDLYNMYPDDMAGRAIPDEKRYNAFPAMSWYMEGQNAASDLKACLLAIYRRWAGTYNKAFGWRNPESRGCDNCRWRDTVTEADSPQHKTGETDTTSEDAGRSRTICALTGDFIDKQWVELRAENELRNAGGKDTVRLASGRTTRKDRQKENILRDEGYGCAHHVFFYQDEKSGQWVVHEPLPENIPWQGRTVFTPDITVDGSEVLAPSAKEFHHALDGKLIKLPAAVRKSCGPDWSEKHRQVVASVARKAGFAREHEVDALVELVRADLEQQEQSEAPAVH